MSKARRSNIAHRHHYVPEFHLARFTPTKSKDDRLWVTDLKTAKSWQDLPRNLAWARDFYSVDLPGLSADAVELAIAREWESPAAHVLEVITGGSAVPAEDLGTLLEYVALLATRVPAARRKARGALERAVVERVCQDTESRESWQAVVQGAKRFGISLDDDEDLEELRLAITGGHVRVNMDQSHAVASVLESGEAVFDALVQRAWSVVVAADPYVFICSDNPTNLDLEFVPRGPLRPMVRVPCDAVFVPLSPEVALGADVPGDAATFRFSRGVPPADDKMKAGVAAINAVTALSAERFIYSTREDFFCALPGGAIGGKAQFLESYGRLKETHGASRVSPPQHERSDI